MRQPARYLVPSAALILAAALIWFFWPRTSELDESADPASPPTIPARPGILVLALDTVRGDHLHCAGMDWIQTPNIDALAADGVRFANCLATAPWTGPSFASIYTGLLPYRHGYLGGEYEGLGEDKVTMAEYLTAAGYLTAAYVTIAYLTGICGMDQGYQIGQKFDFDGSDTSARGVTGSAQQFLSRHGAKPFFLFLHYFDAHAPYTPPPPFDRMYYRGDEKTSGEPLLDYLKSEANPTPQRDWIYDWLEGVTDWEFPARQYAAGVSFVDDQVGRVLSHVKQEGLYDDLLIVLVSDHGEHLAEHGLYYSHQLPYQETLHVPLIIKWPQGRYGGRVVEQRVSTLDILPTLMQILGLALPPNLDGLSLVGLLEGTADWTARPFLAEQGADENAFCKVLIDGSWKYMLFSADGRLMPQLFDLSADPGELQNVARQKQDLLAKYHADLWRIFDRERPLTTEPPVEARTVDKETAERLRALGYVR